jgi:ATP-dependent DNA ligase
MLGALTRELPLDGYVYEPKWDGFRCVVRRDGRDVDLRSRHDRPFTRYFPEIAGELRTLPAERFVLDGEILVATADGFDFSALMLRLHPAHSRVARLSEERPAGLVAFDLLAIGDDDLLAAPFATRRERLEHLLREPPPRISATPQTTDAAEAAAWLAAARGDGIDGVMAKRPDAPYEPGRRAMLKVKPERTADCVVGGLRVSAGPEPLVTALLLGLYDDEDLLRHIGVASSFARAQQQAFAADLAPLTVPLEGHPWEHGFLLEGGPLGRLKGAAGRWRPGMPVDWVPVAPVRVCEVAYGQVDDGRLRHPARFRRWRPDREPASCRFDQLAVAQGARSAPAG